MKFAKRIELKYSHPKKKRKKKQRSATEANTELLVEAPSEVQSPETDEQARCTQLVCYLTGSIILIIVIAVKC